MDTSDGSRIPQGELDSDDITRLLGAAQGGVPGAMDEVFASVYPKLREMAQSRRRGWHGNFTMNTTALIHEAYVKVARQGQDAVYENRGHFFAVAAKAMRQVLINYAEKQSAKKRGGGAAQVTLYEKDAVHEEALDELLALEAALKKLETLSHRQAQVVECLFFAGLGVQETAEALEISPATVKRDWSAARAWLYREIQGGV
ncbi:MAG: sigma-70 family RNA polymerase sigma factor [Gemmatimonadetes bacterium]|nr:sigma-70 family RNA polymerase sigma factor [Gemmatimonadota bacterium]